MRIDSNIISIFILAVVYIASVSLNFTKSSKKSYFYSIIYVLMTMLLIQVAINTLFINNDEIGKVLTSPLRGLYLAAAPLIPAFCALHITKQKNPRILADKKTVALYFAPTAINLIFILLGNATRFNTIIISIVPVIYSIFVVARHWVVDTAKANVSYIMFSLVSSLPIIFGELSLTFVSIAMLAMFLTNEIAETRKDSLTGIKNRKYLFDYIQRLINLKKKFTVVMFDLDKLKHINDTYGHVEGDEAIKNATSIISSQIRQKDFFARYAGDEFVLVIETCDRYNVRRLLQRIDKAFIEYNIQSQKGYTLSISAGYYVNQEMNTCINELIEKADSQMFKNKKRKLVENWQTNIKLLSVYK